MGFLLYWVISFIAFWAISIFVAVDVIKTIYHDYRIDEKRYRLVNVGPRSSSTKTIIYSIIPIWNNIITLGVILVALSCFDRLVEGYTERLMVEDRTSGERFELTKSTFERRY